MTFDNLSDSDLIIINNLMNSFCNGLSFIDYKLLFYHDRSFLLRILFKVHKALHSEELQEKIKDSDLSCDLLHDIWWNFNPRYISHLNKDEIEVVILALDEICNHYLDSEMDIRIGGTYEDIKKLKIKLKNLLIIQDYMFLEWSKFKYYHAINNDVSPLNLSFLIYFFSTEYTPYNDYRMYDKELLNRSMSDYDGNFVYNDCENKMLYIGCAEWLFDETIKAPTLETFSYYVNEINSCKISHENFKELASKMMKLKSNPAPFAVVYRDSSDWIRCKGFSFKEELELFPENY